MAVSRCRQGAIRDPGDLSTTPTLVSARPATHCASSSGTHTASTAATATAAATAPTAFVIVIRFAGANVLLGGTPGRLLIDFGADNEILIQPFTSHPPEDKFAILGLFGHGSSVRIEPLDLRPKSTLENRRPNHMHHHRHSSDVQRREWWNLAEEFPLPDTGLGIVLDLYFNLEIAAEILWNQQLDSRSRSRKHFDNRTTRWCPWCFSSKNQVHCIRQIIRGTDMDQHIGFLGKHSLDPGHTIQAGDSGGFHMTRSDIEPSPKLYFGPSDWFLGFSIQNDNWNGWGGVQHLAPRNGGQQEERAEKNPG
jgi:hypothetical protein